MLSLTLIAIAAAVLSASAPVPQEAQNPTYSPDSTKIAYTLGGDLWCVDADGTNSLRLTADGSETILNGYASWVYYEEILGRSSNYRSFWWSPDSKTIAFYRYDQSRVPVFPIYSPFGQDGTLRLTRYPKAGEPNPSVKVGFASVDGGVVWADIDSGPDGYLGIPFWRTDSKSFYVPREPRIQNTLDLYQINPADGGSGSIYHEEVSTWLDWPQDMLFTDKGLYMVRDFRTGWQQIYFLSYDGKTLRQLTDGPNWRISLLRADANGTVWFLAERDSRVRQTLYKLTPKGKIIAMTDPSYYVRDVAFAPDGKRFEASLSNLHTPWFRAEFDSSKPGKCLRVVQPSEELPEGFAPGSIVEIKTRDGLSLPGVIYYPEGFDPRKQYPVHVDIYGGPDTPLVYDRWTSPARYSWYSRSGIIELVADCRAAGHNGREGLDAIYRQLGTVEVEDFVDWARYLQSLPYVKADKIGVEGFSFGGTMTALLVAEAPDYYHYGIAGGGVYDWALYDTHYTERFMSTPQDNPEGYEKTKVISRISAYKGSVAGDDIMLKLTHGTGDDNVHFQNTLQLIDAMQKQGSSFEFMVYPDGMHGYRGYQGVHFHMENQAFWSRYLLE